MTLEEWREILENQRGLDPGQVVRVLDAWEADRKALAKRIVELEKKPNIVVLSDGDGWHWIYINNELKYEGHRTDIETLCKELKFPYEYRDWDAGEFGEIKPPEKLDAPTS